MILQKCLSGQSLLVTSISSQLFSEMSVAQKEIYCCISQQPQTDQFNEPLKAMEVCTVCGALLVVGDAQQRVEEHIMGKQHSGYARIRAYVDQKIKVSKKTCVK